MKLLVQLIPATHCFVSLPVQLVERILSKPSDGRTLVKVQWGSQELVLAWSGEVSQGPHIIEIPSDVGLCCHIESNAEVEVSIVDSKTLYEAVRVMMEPVTVEDWEMLDLNAGVVEAQMMNQVATVKENQIVPVWVNSSTVVRMMVKETVPSGICKLVDGTEVIVAPKPRTVPNGTSLNGQDVAPTPVHRPKSAILRIHHYFAGNVSTHLICDRQTMERLHWSDGLLVCAASISNTLPFLQRMNHSLSPTVTTQHTPEKSSTNTNSKLYLRVFGSPSVQPNHALIHINAACQLNLHQFSRLLIQPQPSSAKYQQLHRLLLKPLRWSSSPSQKITVPTSAQITEQVNKWMSSNAGRAIRNSTKKSIGSYAVPLTNGTLIALEGQHYIAYCNIVPLSGHYADAEGPTSNFDETRAVLAEMSSDMSSDGTRTTSNLHTISSMVPNLPGMAVLQQIDQVREAGARVLEAKTEGKLRASRDAAQLAAQQEMIKELFMIDSDAIFSSDTIELGPIVDSPWVFPLDYFLPSKPPTTTVASSNVAPSKFTSHSRTSSNSVFSTATTAAGFDLVSASQSRQPVQFPPSPFNGICAPKSSHLLFTTGDIGGLDSEIATSIEAVTNCLGRQKLKHQLGWNSGGTILLTGQHGCGKSMVLRALGNHFANFHDVPVCPLFVSCSEYSGMKIAKILENLGQVFQDAIFCQPSLVLLDDLDLVSPAENSENQQAAAAKTHYAQILATLIKFIESIIHKQHDIAIVATAQANTAVHANLLHPYYLLKHIPLPSPNLKSRVSIMQKIISRKGLILCGDHGEVLDEKSNISFSELSRVAIRTDGYLGSDIEQLIDRAVHAASVRLIESQVGGDRTGTNSARDSTIVPAVPAQNTLITNSVSSSALPSHTEETNSDVTGELTESGELSILDYPTPFSYQNTAASGNTLQFVRPAISAPLMLEVQEGFVPISLRGASLNVSSKTSWEDVGGLDTLKANLQETIEWPTKYGFLFKNSPIRARSGILLFGPSGCGKTLVANAIAKECGLNFISVKGPELLNKYIGQSEQSVRDVFARAQSASPCVLFFDEFDAIAPRRGHDNTGVTDRVVNQFLTELDGVEGLTGVYVLAASSRPELIDPALLRPGRLDKSYYIGYPEAEDRVSILRALGRKMSFAPDVDLQLVATWTQHCTGADLQALLYNAQIEAIHQRLDDAKSKRTLSTIASNGSGLEYQYPSLRTAAEQMMVLKYADLRPTNTSSESSTHAFTTSSSTTVMSIAAKEQHLKKLEVVQTSLYDDMSNSLRPSETASLSSSDTSSGVIIDMTHLKKAFSGLTPSSSPAERKRNEQTYASFLASRGTDFADVASVLANQKATLA